MNLLQYFYLENEFLEMLDTSYKKIKDQFDGHYLKTDTDNLIISIRTFLTEALRLLTN
jgi:hypothetical protein